MPCLRFRPRCCCGDAEIRSLFVASPLGIIEAVRDFYSLCSPPFGFFLPFVLFTNSSGSRLCVPLRLRERSYRSLRIQEKNRPPCMRMVGCTTCSTPARCPHTAGTSSHPLFSCTRRSVQPVRAVEFGASLSLVAKRHSLSISLLVPGGHCPRYCHRTRMLLLSAQSCIGRT